VSRVLPLLLFALAGLLLGGAISMLRQGAGKLAVLLFTVLAALALAGAVAWW
jgi:hypothetical protein